MRARACSRAPPKLCHGVRPSHAEGAQLGDLHEVLWAHRERKRDRIGDALDRDPAVLHRGDEVNAGSERKANFFDRSRAVIGKLLGMDGEWD